MKNQLLKLRKAEGFVSIETIIVAAIMVLAGIVAYNVLYSQTLENKVLNARGMLSDATPDDLHSSEEFFNMEFDNLDD